ncbi:PH domain-containing protein [Streptomyces sp. SID12501]|uniref:PH domain-containing protein n=1 Tax=Streptomyces sp. SID12501 TaxID=2706042 RepID=A0A6B3C2W4_9ACTN|nr:PH domain-containing protein [Streptomyces sp. SID12501]NEC90958.1 PH domain-containing protein [Streptomyces sp. SID12501]
MGGDVGVGGRDGDGIEREYRKRRKAPRGWLAYLGLMVVSCLLQISSPTGRSWERAVLLTFFAAVVVQGVLFMYRARTLMDRRGVVVRGFVIERRWAWHDVYDFRAQSLPKAPSFGRKWLVFLYDTDGRRFLLPHVDDWQLDDPPAEVDELRAVAARHRGTAWEPRPATEAHILRRTAHRKAWERAVIGALIVFVCTSLVLVVLTITTDDPPTPLLLLWVPLAAFAPIAAFLHWRCARAVAHA